MSLPRFYGKSLEKNLKNNMEREKALENAKKLVSMLWKKENLQYGKGYVMHFVSLSKIRDFGNRSA